MHKNLHINKLTQLSSIRNRFPGFYYALTLSDRQIIHRSDRLVVDRFGFFQMSISKFRQSIRPVSLAVAGASERQTIFGPRFEQRVEIYLVSSSQTFRSNIRRVDCRGSVLTSTRIVIRQDHFVMRRLLDSLGGD